MFLAVGRLISILYLFILKTERPGATSLPEQWVEPLIFIVIFMGIEEYNGWLSRNNKNVDRLEY